MTETEKKRREVTFDTGLPRGTCATFTHEGERWIAYPQSKMLAILTVNDRLLGVLGGIHADLIRWMNAHPEDAARVVRILTRVNRIQELYDELATEKVRAATM